MKWWVSSVLILVSLITLDKFVSIREKVDQKLWPVEKYFFSIRGWIDSVKTCAVNSSGVKREPEEIMSVSRISSGEVLIKGRGKKGDLVIDVNGRILGIVDENFGNWVLVKTPLSEKFKIFVSVTDGKEILEGELIGGDPPLVRVQEKIELKGWKVFISKSVSLGGYIREFGKGEIGKIIGKKGDLWIMKPNAGYKGLVIVGK